ncbi:hypothetical protein C8J55DRAFT_514080 [Lentinula edodes]|uniref:Uncharacterized protein n=1 Tax=Lentinula lateritia TaxID=40482 RepID=A0A9W9ACK1_9AGAR|nr:hypothetical protein C8J55DRAFT_514080 [Lentinula edodes]
MRMTSPLAIRYANWNEVLINVSRSSKLSFATCLKCSTATVCLTPIDGRILTSLARHPRMLALGL